MLPKRACPPKMNQINDAPRSRTAMRALTQESSDVTHFPDKKKIIVAAVPLPREAKKASVPVAGPALRASARAHRIVDLSQPHNTNTQEGALLFALQILSGAQTTWEYLRQVGASDAEIEDAVERYFPVLLGFHAERQKGFYIGRRPEPFFLWGNASAAGGCLVGAALLRKVRSVLCLPDRTPKK